MGDASYLQSNFHGGEISKNFQGRYDLPNYRTFMAVSFNGLPIETGAWVRRPGTQFTGTTRGGVAGRLIKFDFEADSPYNMEFTNGHLRFWTGPKLATTNFATGVVSISTANPAVVETSFPTGWATNDQVYFNNLGTMTPLLQKRVFRMAVVDATHFGLYDSITGASIDGSTLGWATTPGVFAERVHDLATPYGAGIWSSLRSVQTDDASFLLNGQVPPYILTITLSPITDVRFANFALAPLVFNDGPYLDPFINGVNANPSAKVGIIAITLSFPAYVATVAYAAGAFVTYSAVNYRSLTDQNVNHQPDINPTRWTPVDAATAISPQGFQGSDVGRLVRFFSEPALWDVAATYAAGAVVAFNPSGLPGQTTYWTSLIGSNIGKQPGLDLVSWTLTPQGAAIWTWGKITSLVNLISGALAGSLNIGSLIGGGGVAAAFDGVPNKIGAASASLDGSGVTSLSGFVGKDYSGAADQKIGSVTIYPSIDIGFTQFTFQVPHTGETNVSHPRLVLNIYGSATAPAFSGNGTLLGTTGLINSGLLPVTIASSDTTTAWKYVWVEIIGETLGPQFMMDYSLYIAQVEFLKPLDAGATASNGVNVEILGPPLLYTTGIRTWRLGVYSNTTGWPTCGTYHEGRLWLSGVVPNRIDACVSNGIIGGAVNFAPTDQYGTVAPSSAISYVFNAPDANPIFWMMPDLKGIICGTKAGEWLLHPPTPGSLSPFNIAAQRNTNVRCANIEPRRTEHTTVFVQAYQRKVLEYFDDIYSGKFTGPSLQDAAKHLTINGIDEVVYQQELAPIIWVRVAGDLIGCTYKRDTPAATTKPTIEGWHRHELGSNNVVESLCVGPSVDGTLDSLSMITATADGIRHVEIMTDIVEEGAALASCSYLDSAVEPSSRTSTLIASTGAPLGGMTLNGLWHLNGKTVAVFAGGLDCGNPGEGNPIVGFVVSNGSVFVPYGDGISAGSGEGLFTPEFAETARILVGFTYTSDGQIVRPNAPAESGARNGPAFAKTRRNHFYAIQVENTRGLSIGTDFTKLLPIPFQDAAGISMTPLQTFTGLYRDTLDDDYGFDGMLCWRQTRPYPANVIAIGGFIRTQDR